MDSDSLTFEESMELIEKQELESEAHKAEIFERVFDSIRSDSSETVEIPSDIQQAWSDRERAIKEKKAQKEAVEKKKQETRFIDEQKEQLRTRFEQGSADSLGVDPLANRRGEEGDDDELFGNEAVQQQEREFLTSFKMQDLLQSDAFNEILESLEKELAEEAKADPKTVGDDEPEECSELGEVLNFLNAQALTNSGALTEDIMRPRAVPVQLSPAEQEPPAPVSEVGEAPQEKVVVSGNASSNPPSVLAEATNAAVAKTMEGNPADPVKANKPAPVTQQPSSRFQQSSRNSRRVPVEEPEESDSSDDDGDWRKHRQQMKSNANATSDSLRGTTDKGDVPKVWGAYGASTSDTAAGVRLQTIRDKHNTPYDAGSQYFQYGRQKPVEWIESNESVEHANAIDMAESAPDSDDESQGNEEEVISVSVNDDSEGVEEVPVPPTPVEEAAVEVAAVSSVPFDGVVLPPTPPAHVPTDAGILDDDGEAQESAPRPDVIVSNLSSLQRRSGRKKDKLINKIAAAADKNSKTTVVSSKDIKEDKAVPMPTIAAADACAPEVAVVSVDTAEEPSRDAVAENVEENKTCMDKPNAYVAIEKVDQVYPSSIPSEYLTIAENMHASGHLQTCPLALVVLTDPRGKEDGTNVCLQDFVTISGKDDESSSKQLLESNSSGFLLGLYRWLSEQAVIANLFSFVGMQQHVTISNQTEIVVGIELKNIANKAYSYIDQRIKEAVGQVQNSVKAFSLTFKEGESYVLDKAITLYHADNSSSADEVALFSMYLDTLVNPPANFSDAPDGDTCYCYRSVSCCVKEYVWKAQRMDIVMCFVRECEESGLALVGMRTAYSTIDCNPVESMCLVLYFLCCCDTTAMVIPSDASSPKNNVSTAISEAAASILRRILGPDDCLLAKRTDPHSLRGLYGGIETIRSGENSSAAVVADREYNIVSPISYSATNLLKEMLLYTSPRKNAMVKNVNRLFSLVRLPLERQYRLCCSLDYHLDSTTDGDVQCHTIACSSQLSLLQKTVWTSIDHSVFAKLGACSVALNSYSRTEYEALLRHYGGDDISPRERQSRSTSAYCGSYFVLGLKCRAHPYALSSIVSHLEQTIAKTIDSSHHFIIPAFFESLSSPPKEPAGSIGWKIETRLHLSKHKVSEQPEHDDDVFLLQLQSSLSSLPSAMNKRMAIADLLLNKPTSGSPFEAALRSVVSHEDISLADTVVITFESSTANLNMASDSVHLHINSFLEQFPLSCEVVIVGFKTLSGSRSQNCDGNKSTVAVIIRGQHLLENIDYVVNLYQNPLVAPAVGFGRPSTSDNSPHSQPDRPAIKVLKGKKMLELITKEFHACRLCLTPAIYDALYRVPAFSHIYSLSTSSLPSAALPALFPPASFQSVSVVLVPFQFNSSKTLTQLLKCLERNLLEVLNISIIPVTENIVKMVYSDYSLSSSSLDFNANESSSRSHSPSALAGRSVTIQQEIAFALVVRGNAVFTRLDSIIKQFNITINAFDSENPYSFPLASNKTSLVSPCSFVYCVSSISSANEMLKVVYSSDSSLPIQELLSRSNFPFLSKYSTSHTAEAHEEDEEDEAVYNTDFSSLMKSLHQTSAASFNFNPPDGLDVVAGGVSPGSHMAAVGGHNNVSCIAITQALMIQHGLHAIMDILVREKIQIVNCKTCFIDSKIAKQLLNLAGQSSLTIKPSMSLLTAGHRPACATSMSEAALLTHTPVLFLAIEGAGTAIMKVKGLQLSCSPYPTINHGSSQDSAYKNCLWKLNSDVQVVGHVTWGALLSSAPSLSKQLLFFCFANLFGKMQYISAQSLKSCIASPDVSPTRSAYHTPLTSQTPLPPVPTDDDLEYHTAQKLKYADEHDA